MRHFCTFLAVVKKLEEHTVHFDFYHLSKQPQPVRQLLKANAWLPRHYFDYLLYSGVLEVDSGQPYVPAPAQPAAIGMNIRSLGSTVVFDMCFSPQTYKLWQKADAFLDDLSLAADVFEEYVYRLGAISRFRHLGRVDDPVVAAQLGENDMIEFKRDFLLSKGGIIKSVVAFANSNNGNLFLGISDEGEIIGVNHELKQYGDPDKYLLAITQYIQDKTTPFLSPFPKISLKKVQDKYVVAIFVEVGSELVCGLDKNGDKYVAIRTNNRSVIVKDPHQIGEIYVKRKLGSEISRRLGLL
ncbi:AlbA family DNA-binding domain-containing protein [Brevibacillus thermoruber]|uniref:ATP-binding protein n=1 Tax=Brevibacillus thermoruber TaxID=33942 RepID=A0A9X3TPP2_9BACL|nr:MULTISPECIES: ATP-binding protein [Brevibacillus]MDA5108055.1 ATP-binding protein [Brevibacillus thermoruber]TRY26672.1 ATP-binding protein [Brevibacillus sp. LEMMJ03]UYZ15353.1 ATP-binding protein [Brevibacillus sp. WF146]